MATPAHPPRAEVPDHAGAAPPPAAPARSESPSFALQPARAPATPTPRPAGPERAREVLEEGRPLWMEQFQIPLNGLPDSLLAELDRLGPTFEGWGRRDDELHEPFFVDVGGRRFYGRTLRIAIANARARRARPAAQEDDGAP